MRAVAPDYNFAEPLCADAVFEPVFCVSQDVDRVVKERDASTCAVGYLCVNRKVFHYGVVFSLK